MRTIYKYGLAISDLFVIKMPANAKILTVSNQSELGFMWVEVDTAEKDVRRYFSVHGTGHALRPPGVDVYVGTWQDAVGGYAWHLYEVIKKPE